jgi:hypothetical protein
MHERARTDNSNSTTQERLIPATIDPRRGARRVVYDLVLGFTDFGRIPDVAVPNATQECPYTPSGD